MPRIPAVAPSLLVLAVACAGCGRAPAPEGDFSGVEASAPPSAPPAADPADPAPARADEAAGAAIVVPDADDVTMQPRQAPITAAAESPPAPMPDNADVAYACEDGGRVRVVWTRSHANLSLDGVFQPLSPWREESLRTGAEAWAGDHMTLLRRGGVIELREADGDLRRCRAGAGG